MLGPGSNGWKAGNLVRTSIITSIIIIMIITLIIIVIVINGEEHIPNAD